MNGIWECGPDLPTAAQMRDLEARAIGAGEVTATDLMERAGQGVVAAILETWPDLGEGKRRALVLCGPGNNGGDGYVVARLLRGMGWRTQVAGAKDASAMPDAARENRERWERDEPVHALDGAGIAALFDPAGQAQPDIVVDALFGIGLNRAPAGLDALCARYREGAMPRRVAIDLPTGSAPTAGASLPIPTIPTGAWSWTPTSP